MSSQAPSVRFAPEFQRWLDAYSDASPAWDGAAAEPATPRSAPVAPAASASAWRVIREVRQVWVSTPTRSRADIVAAVAGSTGVAPEAVTAAIAYWAEHPDEVNARLRA